MQQLSQSVLNKDETEDKGDGKWRGRKHGTKLSEGEKEQ